MTHWVLSYYNSWLYCDIKGFLYIWNRSCLIAFIFSIPEIGECSTNAECLAGKATCDIANKDCVCNTGLIGSGVAGNDDNCGE